MTEGSQVADLPEAASRRRLETAHHRLQLSFYLTESRPVELGPGRGECRAFFAAGMSEPQWNHAICPEDLESPEDHGSPNDLVERVEQLYASRGLPPAWELSAEPASAFEADLRRCLHRRGYERCYRHAWLVPGPGLPRSPETPAPRADDARDDSIRDAGSAEDLEACFAVFRAVYPDGLDEGYRRAFLGTPSSDGCTVVHHLVRDGDEAVAVASSIHGQTGEVAGITGLYNLAVLPAHRRRGLGGLLTAYRVREAVERGQHLVFLQTEKSAVETWQRRHGFHLAFVTEGFALPPEAPREEWT